jgi:hypothetical protein
MMMDRRMDMDGWRHAQKRQEKTLKNTIKTVSHLCCCAHRVAEAMHLKTCHVTVINMR